MFKLNDLSLKINVFKLGIIQNNLITYNLSCLPWECVELAEYMFIKD